MKKRQVRLVDGVISKDIILWKLLALEIVIHNNEKDVGVISKDILWFTLLKFNNDDDFMPKLFNNPMTIK